ncbi:MAG: hypothetical protein R3C61_27210 [Bacteroidia bacterium]
MYCFIHTTEEDYVFTFPDRPGFCPFSTFCNRIDPEIISGDQENHCSAVSHNRWLNQDAPSLVAGNYEAAIRIPATDLSGLEGRKLTEIYYFIREKPSSCTVKVYKKSDSNAPAEQIYSTATTSEVKAGSWNKHILSTPVEITNDDLWISVKVGHTANTRSIGCDPGPAVENGDWLFDDSDNEWRPLSDRAAISINWNIRGVVAP